MPVELGSFDAIIGMDWLAKYQAIIVCAEKIVRISWGNETLIKYMLKGCAIFLAHVTTKEIKDELEKKRLEDVPIVQNFPEVFPEDLSARAPYRLAPSEMKELTEQLKELSDKGFIRPSSSPWGAPVLFVKKKVLVVSRRQAHGIVLNVINLPSAEQVNGDRIVIPS
ncbi:hypothetical protein Tco_0770662 [Tanacetum coccineum]|uniref:Reverse transcriptase domain-containing protein n=1 Tax=Tanacetum coccineum TaxID=301880 RepID=A0ABQ4ZE61_9ASTR